MTIDDIIKFVETWRASHGYGAGEVLSSAQMEVFIGELQQQISYMDFSLPKGTTVIGYAGESNAVPAWSIVKNVSETYGDAAAYITTLPAGQLLNNRRFKGALFDFLLQDEDALNMITSGYKDGVRVGSSCGYGDYLTLDDFVSSKLMGESVGVSENVIIFCPGEVDPNKVFAATEIDKIFSNNSFKYINGISKEELYAIYRSGEEGKKTVFQIISRTSQEAVGGALELNEQAEALRIAFGENGILNSSSSDFVLNVCFDSQGNQIGMELFSCRKNSSLLSDYTGERYIISGSGSNVAFKAEYSHYMNYADDVTMELEFGAEYNSLTEVEKLQAKELEFYVCNIGIADQELLSSTTLKYLEGSKKTVEELSAVDRQIINLCSNLSIENAKGIKQANQFLKSIQSSEKFAQIVKGAKVAGRLVEAAIVAITVVDTVSRANEAIEGGRPYEAAGIVVGSCSDLAITFLGGEALTEVLLPYFAGAGMAIAGPAGAVVGGLIAGIIGFGTSSFVGGLVDDLVEGFFGLLDDLFSDAGTAVRYVADPLVIDLDGDGFELLPLANGVYFNENAEGLREKTQWVKPDDALLAIDLNGDGIINDGSELFGTSTTLTDGSKAKSGFEALAQYDENGDGIIDEKDAAYSQMLVWRDRNSDGVSQEEELVSLQEAGIQSISLNHYDEDGRRVAGITFNDGKTGKIGEFNFEAQLYNAKELEEIEISDEIKMLANVRAIGNVASLHTMMQVDESGTLKGYVKAFAQAETIAEKEELLTKILYRIAGAEQVAAGSRGTEFDAQKLTVVEAFMGRDFVGTAGRNPVNTAATILEGVYTDIYEIYYNLLNAETALKDYLGMTFWIKDENENKYLDTSFFYAYVDYCRKEGNDMTSIVADMGRYIASINAPNKENFADYLFMYEGNKEYVEAIRNYCPENMLIGTGEGKTLQAGSHDTYLLGLIGNNSLYGGRGDDYLRSGIGNDYLNGGEGKDIYRFDLGWGKDRINNYDTGSGRIHDRIEFGEGIRGEDLHLIRKGNNLIITHKETGDQIEITSAYYYSDGRYFLEKIGFSDGTEWGLEEIAERVAEAVGMGSEGDDSLSGYEDSYGYSRNETFHGGAGNDTIYGNNGNDVLYGEEGNDSLSGGYGDDILEGGTGNDYLEGGEGKDIYRFDFGWGKDRIYNYDTGSGRIYDRIEFGEGIRGEDLHLIRKGNNLIITHKETGDQIEITSAYYYSDGRYFLEKIGFSDGTEWGLEEIAERVAEAVGAGSEGDDRLDGYGDGYGYSGDETFHGGAGNDTIYGNNGNDVLYGEEGNDSLSGGNGNDLLDGGSGNDSLSGGYGDDILEGGTGNDYLEGGEGKDIYRFDLGWGKDRIYNYDTGSGRIYDRIEFGEGIRGEDLHLIRKGNNLIITHKETGDQIEITSAYYYSDGRYFLEKIGFSDGTEWGLEEIAERVAEAVGAGSEGDDRLDGYGDGYGYSGDETFHGGAGNDTIYGNNGNDVLYGEEGNDSLSGGNGNDLLDGGSGNDSLSGGYGDDILEGGTGNDYLEGGEGKDIYRFDLGWGKDRIYNYDTGSGRIYDRIEFGEGIRGEDLHLIRKGNNLIITHKETGDQIEITSAYYYSDGRYFLEKIGFSDGTEWGLEEIAERVAEAVGAGSEGDDRLDGYGDGYGYSGDETFHGEPGTTPFMGITEMMFCTERKGTTAFLEETETIFWMGEAETTAFLEDTETTYWKEEPGTIIWKEGKERTSTASILDGGKTASTTMTREAGGYMTG